MLCWTLGITEHHNAVDNVLSLINLALLTGHVGPLRQRRQSAARPEQRPGRRRHGRHPQQARRLPGHREGRRGAEALRAKLGLPIIPKYGLHLTQMFEAMEHGDLRAALRDRREPGALRGRRHPCRASARGLDILVVQDIFMTKTAEIADVVFPASVAASRRRARSPTASGGSSACARRWTRRGTRATTSGSSPSWRGASGCDWGARRPRSRPGRSCARSLPCTRAWRTGAIEELGGIQWPCPDETHPGTQFLHARLWDEDPAARGMLAPFSAVVDDPPVDKLTDEFPLRLTTGRRLDSYNTGRADRRLHFAPAPRARPSSSRPRRPIARCRWTMSACA